MPRLGSRVRIPSPAPNFPNLPGARSIRSGRSAARLLAAGNARFARHGRGGRTLLAAEPRRMPPRLVHDHRGDDAAAAVFADLCRAARRLGSRRDRAMVGRRLWRDLLCRRAGRAAVGPPGRPLRPQADADPREPRHGGRDVADRHGPQCVGTGGLAPVRRLRRRLRLRLDDPGGDANAEGALRMGARHADVRHHGRQSGRSADRRRAAAADRHQGNVLARRRRHLPDLHRDHRLHQGRQAAGVDQESSRRRPAGRKFPTSGRSSPCWRWGCC